MLLVGVGFVVVVGSAWLLVLAPPRVVSSSFSSRFSSPQSAGQLSQSNNRFARAQRDCAARKKSANSLTHYFVGRLPKTANRKK